MVKRSVGRNGGLSFASRVRIAALIGYTILALIIFRIWYLQGLSGAYYRDLSENNRIRTLRTTPARGAVFDREGRLLVGNRPAFNVALLLEDTPDVSETLKILSEVSGRSLEEIERRFRSKKNRPFEPKVVIPDISREELAKIKVNSFRLPGVIIDTVPTRSYPHETLASQALGYAREISRGELKLRRASYRRGDYIGKSGLEREWEDVLRGKSGVVQLEVDAMGHRRKNLGIVDYTPGKDVYLTIDLDLQEAASAAFDGRRGALVALDPRSGEVLALVSSPSYNANIFTGEMLIEDWELVERDADRPLRNRAIADSYPPGSTFKLLMAVAGLTEGLITAESESHCPGYHVFGRRRYRCHKRQGHGKVNLREAIRMSCNVFFYELGLKLGVERIEQYARLFGLGEKTGIKLSGEEPGIVPSKKWKKKVYGERWYPGDTVPVTIGQGYLTVTPIQMANAMAILANGGKHYKPSLVYKVVDPNKENETIQYRPQLLNSGALSPRALEIVKEMAADVVQHERGTGRRAAIPGVEVGGKTGTAQVSSLRSGAKGERFKDHAWFIAFAPVEQPTIALAVIVENAGHGGVEAAPVARAVLEAYFGKRGMLVEESSSEEI